MALNTAQLEVTVKTNQLGKRESLSYKWIGDSPYMFVSMPMLKELGYSREDEEISIGPYKLIKLTHFAHMDSIRYVRKDKFGALRVWIHKATRPLDLAYRRFIITLAVWNLAEYQEQSIPTWRDIKVLRYEKLIRHKN